MQRSPTAGEDDDAVGREGNPGAHLQAALLLAANNVFEMIAYRRTIPWGTSAAVIVSTIEGAANGASLLVDAPETLVGARRHVVASPCCSGRRWRATASAILTIFT